MEAEEHTQFVEVEVEVVEDEEVEDEEVEDEEVEDEEVEGEGLEGKECTQLVGVHSEVADIL